MAAKRSIPTDLFWDETFSEMSSDAQSIFLGLLLNADDYGRGPASSKGLARMLAKAPELIASTLEVLHDSQFIQCYQVEGKHYYHIRTWDEWERLDQRARSRYPAPPDISAFPEKAPGIPEIPRETPPEGEEEGEEKRREPEEEGGSTPGGERHHVQRDPGRKVVPFPGTPPSADGDGSGKTRKPSEAETRALVQHTARILRLPPDEALTRLVVEYASLAGISLPGEADAAREWIDDPQRNTRGRRMSLHFFRNWLKREREALERRQAALPSPQRFTGTGGPAPFPSVAPPVRRPPDLMHLADEDQRVARAKGAMR